MAWGGIAQRNFDFTDTKGCGLVSHLLAGKEAAGSPFAVPVRCPPEKLQSEPFLLVFENAPSCFAFWFPKTCAWDRAGNFLLHNMNIKRNPYLLYSAGMQWPYRPPVLLNAIVNNQLWQTTWNLQNASNVELQEPHNILQSSFSDRISWVRKDP